MKIDAQFTDLRVGENISKNVMVYVEDEYADANVKILFKTPNGVTILTNTIPVESGDGKYALPRILLDGEGTLLAQLYVYSGLEILAKSAIFKFNVKPSISIDGIVEPDVHEYYDPGEVSNRLDYLENKHVVLFDEQVLTDEEKTQARENIGIAPADADDSMTSPVGMDENGLLFSIPYDDSDVVKSVNTLTPDEDGNVDIDIPERISELIGDATHRTVTDEQISAWDGKLDKLDTDGVSVYAHNGSSQTEIGVSNSVTDGDTNIVTGNAVYNFVSSQIGDVESVISMINDLIGGGDS